LLEYRAGSKGFIFSYVAIVYVLKGEPLNLDSPIHLLLLFTTFLFCYLIHFLKGIVLRNSISSKTRAGLTALAVVASSLMGISAAHANVIDPSTPVTLNVVRHESSRPGDRGTGVQANSVPGSPVAGVSFTATRVADIDLTTNEGWIAAARLAASWSPGMPLTLDTAFGPLTTDAQGRVTFATDTHPGFGKGVYLVQETYTPAGHVPSIPFLVTLPMTNPDGSGWMYDVFAYPKGTSVGDENIIVVDPGGNEVTDPDGRPTPEIETDEDGNPITGGDGNPIPLVRPGLIKDVSHDDAFVTGDTVTWNFSAAIPQTTDEDTHITLFRVTEALDSRLANPQVTNVRLTGVYRSATPVVTSEHYTVDTTGGVVAVTLTPAGLALIDSLEVEVNRPRLAFDIETTVVSGGSVAISGQSNLYVSTLPGATPASVQPVLSVNPATPFGHLHVNKVTFGTRAPMADIPFALYASYDDAAADQNRVEINGNSVFYTDADGVLRIDWLRADMVNGAEVATHNWHIRQLATAPGFMLNPAPFDVNVLAEGATVANVGLGLQGRTPLLAGATVAPEVLEIESISINDPENGGFRLPLTGGTDSNLTWLIGLGVLAAGGLGVVIRHKKSATDPAA